MMQKKILVLVMSCTLPYYRAKEKAIKETWAKPILDGKFPGVDLWFFNSGTKNCLDMKTHRIFVNADDRRDRTFQKLAKTLIYVDESPDVFDYDYIIRVNISSVINIPLFQELISHIDNPEEMWTCTTFNQPWVAHHAPFFSGECFMLSKKNIEIVKKFYLENKQGFDLMEADPVSEPKKACDDGWLTEIFYRTYGEKYTDLLKTFGIIYEPFETLYFTNMYNSHLVVCYKTDLPATNDANPMYEKCDEEKRIEISYIVNSEPIPSNWWEYFTENILDKECRSSLFRVEKAYCTKEDVIGKWQEFIKNGTAESEWESKPNPDKIWKSNNKNN